jgi:hypothetical protein
MSSSEIQTDIQSLVDAFKVQADAVKEQAQNELLRTQELAAKNAIARQQVRVEAQRVTQLKQQVDAIRHVEQSLDRLEQRSATFENELQLLTDAVKDTLRLQQMLSSAVLMLIKNGNTAQDRKDVIDRLFHAMENIGVARGTVQIGDRTEFGSVQSSSVAIAEGDIKK